MARAAATTEALAFVTDYSARPYIVELEGEARELMGLQSQRGDGN
jgi:hypothetical protein